ncbi:hypothetical protein LCGC14_2316540 [marine sediment metagenome]|uniref:Uncharacterized protein n=1 Tax=marine sediment metagenome TaxID=412755 RepID=A0A0F9FE04_9ZZZZ
MVIAIIPGENARARVVWRNTAAVPRSPSFRWDLRKAGSSWDEGPVIVASEVGAGLQGEVHVYNRIPFDWDDTTVDAKLMVIGLEGPQWQKNGVYQTVAELPEPSPDEKGEFPWIPVALGVGGAVLIGAALTKKDKGSAKGKV